MSEPAVYGVLALFPSAENLLTAIPKLKAGGYSEIDAYTPYPVHGLDEALDLPKSKLGILVFLMGAFGALGAFGLAWWTNAINYPLLMGGKPYNSWPAWIPVTLEGAIFFGTFTAGLGMLILFNKLPYFGHPVLGSEAMPDIMRDKFALLLKKPTDSPFDPDAAAKALRAAGGDAVEVLPEPIHEKPGAAWWARTIAAIAAACLVAAAGTVGAIKIFPTIPPMVNMENQPRLDPEMPDSFFADDRGMRMPPDGTVPRGDMPILSDSPQSGGRSLINPLPISARVLERGRHMFDLHCAVCHDRLGTGKPWLGSGYQAQPADLQSSTLRSVPDGYIYWVISQGYGPMPAHAADISPDDRWAIVRYIRALQRSQDAPEQDVRWHAIGGRKE